MSDKDFGRTDRGAPGSTYAPNGERRAQPDPAAGEREKTAQPSVDIRQKAKEDVTAIRNLAEEQVSRATDAARETADRQKGWAAEQVGSIGGAIERVGRELEEGDQREMGRLARQMGESVNRFADDIKGRDLSQIASMAEDFGRRQPLAFVGLAALAGLAASRFVTASASRSAAPSSRETRAARAGRPVTSETKPTETRTATGPATEQPYGQPNR
ncbi:nutrient deprivation-induced protein [Rhizobium oryzicola]|uniref:Nutrient deprivation-induced protein n=1 Tax=Rhizobium oryzicola TaxID=1232668 RepID=A0ABT8SQU1_9HYPH|nr:nutrient deprivation-induced protein [Rhizobium oryzicola]MDO1580625.1 nutrient deprivation-induced protein [Rhizobium oryzicola]